MRYEPSGTILTTRVSWSGGGFGLYSGNNDNNESSACQVSTVLSHDIHDKSDGVIPASTLFCPLILLNARHNTNNYQFKSLPSIILLSFLRPTIDCSICSSSVCPLGGCFSWKLTSQDWHLSSLLFTTNQIWLWGMFLITVFWLVNGSNYMGPAQSTIF